MNKQTPSAPEGHGQYADPGEQGRPGGPEPAFCCGPELAEKMQECPCGSFLKEHGVACFGAVLLVVLAFLISQVGGILGIIAFFRTL